MIMTRRNWSVHILQTPIQMVVMDLSLKHVGHFGVFNAVDPCWFQPADRFRRFRAVTND